MISFISGYINMFLENSIIIDNNGIGYEILISNNTLTQLPPIGSSIKLYTYTNIKEDTIHLYGFLSMEEIKVFNMIIGVSGIGPKSALNILSIISPEKLVFAIMTDDINVLSKASGIGKKTAQRIILELKDKVINNDMNNKNLLINKIDSNINNTKKDAVDALLSLGYSKNEALKAISEVYNDEISLEDIIKLSLKKLVK